MDDEIVSLNKKLKELNKKITRSDEYRQKHSRLYNAVLIDSNRESWELKNEMN